MHSTDEIIERMLYRFVNRDSVKAMQRPYVKFFVKAKAKRVLDIGCGRGGFLELLRDVGIKGCGVDGNAEAVAECQQHGFDEVAVGDALEFLDQRVADKAQYDGIFCSHLIEHLPARQGIHLLVASAALLSPGARLVIITPNVTNLNVLTKVFWLDPFHVRPYPRKLIGAVMEECGLQVSSSYDDIRARGGGTGIGRLVRFGLGTIVGQDSVVVGQRPA